MNNNSNFPKLHAAIEAKKQPGYKSEECALNLAVDRLKKQNQIRTSNTHFQMALNTVVGMHLSILEIDVDDIYYSLLVANDESLEEYCDYAPLLVFATKLPISNVADFMDFADDFSLDLLTIEYELKKEVEVKELNNGLKGFCASKIPQLNSKKDIFQFLLDLKDRGYLSAKALGEEE
jgi:hypothetical protein